MNVIGKIAGAVADKLLKTFLPLDAHTRAFMAMHRVADKAAEDLVAAEAERDVYEPLADWERELRDACADDACTPDDLWAAEQRHNNIATLPEGQTIDDFVAAASGDTQTPAGAAHRPSPQPAQGGTGQAHQDVATVIAVVLRGQGINSAAIYADLAARELHHHFTFSRK